MRFLSTSPLRPRLVASLAFGLPKRIGQIPVSCTMPQPTVAMVTSARPSTMIAALM